MTGDDIAARVAELERRLYGRPGASDLALRTGATASDRTAEMEELRELRVQRELRAQQDGGATPAPTPTPAPAPAPTTAPTNSNSPAAPRRRLLIMGVTGVAAVLAGVLVAALTVSPSPPALNVFETPLSPLDQVRSESLQALGLPLLGDGRVLAEFENAPVQVIVFRAAPGTAGLLLDGAESLPDEAEYVGSIYVGSIGPVYDLPAAVDATGAALRRADVCAWVTERGFAIDGRCAPLDEFATDGLSFDTERFGPPYRVVWQPSGAVELTPLPPPDLEP